MASTTSTSDNHTIPYRCGKCRTQLFTSTQLLTHDPPTSENSRYFANKRNERSAGSICSSCFLDPNSNIQLDTLCDSTAANGSITCPQCHHRIGSFDWSGSQCSCGEWVVPSFQVVKSKVDYKLAVPIQVITTSATA
jgi:hypothetical protein